MPWWSTDPNDCDRSFVAKPHRARINFFDLSGLPEYQELRQDFYSDTQGVLLVFDVTRRETFASLQQWLDEMHAAVRLDSCVCTQIMAGLPREGCRRSMWKQG